MVTTLVEFAVVLFLKRKVERLNGKSKISALDYEIDYSNQIYQTPTRECNLESSNGSNPEKMVKVRNATCPRMPFDNKKNSLCNNTSLSTRIDIIVFCLFIFCYLVFNIVYLGVYL